MFRSAYIRKYLKKYMWHYLLGIVGIIPVFRRSTRKIPAFSFPFSVHFPIVISIFRIFKPKIFTPFWAFFIDKFFEICYNNSTL